MPLFESGVASYIVGTATVSVSFPVDFRGNPDVRCAQCRYFGISSRRCKLNDTLIYYPEKYIGSECPLNFYDDKGEEI